MKRGNFIYMSYKLGLIFSFSIGIAAIIGWIRFKKVNPAYYPFIFCMWLGFLNEIIGYFITHRGYSNAINNNIYVLAESLLFTWQFKNWRLFHRSKYLFPLLLISLILIWITEGFLIKGINHMFTYFRIIYSFLIVLMSINMINRQLMRERKSIYKNPIFIICMAFLVYYTFTVIVVVFWQYGLNVSMQFVMNLTTILIYINLFTNLIFALAILWIPTKHRFSLPF